MNKYRILLFSADVVWEQIYFRSCTSSSSPDVYPLFRRLNEWLRFFMRLPLICERIMQTKAANGQLRIDNRLKCGKIGSLWQESTFVSVHAWDLHAAEQNLVYNYRRFVRPPFLRSNSWFWSKERTRTTPHLSPRHWQRIKDKADRFPIIFIISLVSIRFPSQSRRRPRAAFFAFHGGKMRPRR